MANHQWQAMPITHRELEKRWEDLCNRGDAGAMRWLARGSASQTPNQGQVLLLCSRSLEPKRLPDVKKTIPENAPSLQSDLPRQ